MALWTPGLKHYWPLIQQKATEHGLDPYLLAALVLQESSGNTDGFRWEPDFYNRYIRPKNLYPGQNPRRVSSSYGLCQVMLPTAHERGYPKDQPPEGLFVPEVGLEYGCKQLKWLQAWLERTYPTSPPPRRLRALLASYNGGRQGPDALRPRNAAYADSVLRHYATLKAEHQR